MAWWVAMLVGILLCMLISLSGCKTRYVTQEVPVVVEHTNVQHHTDIVRDTLLMRDSVYHYIQGDTTIIERWHTIYKVEKVAIADTIRDSIPVVTEVKVTEVKEVNKLHWWQSALMWLGGILAVLIGCCVWWVFWRIRG